MNWKWTAEKRQAFLNTLAETGVVQKAIDAAGISRAWVYTQRKMDEQFAADWDAALEIGISALEDEAHRRAFDGNLVVTKNGTFKQYSDTLAIFLLKAHRPEKFMEKVRNELTGANGEPLVQLSDDQIAAKLNAIMQRALSRAATVEKPDSDGDDDGENFDDIV